MRKLIVGAVVAALCLGSGVVGANTAGPSKTDLCVKPGAAVHAPDVSGNCQKGFSRIDFSAGLSDVVQRVDGLYRRLAPTLTMTVGETSGAPLVRVTGYNLKPGGEVAIRITNTADPENFTYVAVATTTVASDGTVDWVAGTPADFCGYGIDYFNASAETWDVGLAGAPESYTCSPPSPDY